MKLMKYTSLLKGIAGLKIPLRVQHTVTYKCNLHCTYCGFWKQRTQEMNTEEVKLAMKQFSDAGCVSWGWAGGEPLIRPDMIELCKYGKDLGMSVTLLSNGQILGHFADRLKNIVDFVFVSIDGSPKINDPVRGEGTFNRAVESIKKLKEKNIGVGMQAVLTKKHLENDCEELKFSLELCRELGCNFLISPIFYSVISQPENELLINDKKPYLRAIEILRQYKKEHPEVVANSFVGLDWFKSYGDENASGFNCKAGKLFCHMFPDGKIAPCHLFFKDNFAEGNPDFVGAFNSLKPIPRDCRCWVNCYVEYNNLLSLNPHSIANFAKHFFGKL